MQWVQRLKIRKGKITYVPYELVIDGLAQTSDGFMFIQMDLSYDEMMRRYHNHEPIVDTYLVAYRDKVNQQWVCTDDSFSGLLLAYLIRIFHHIKSTWTHRGKKLSRKVKKAKPNYSPGFIQRKREMRKL